tara:strand:- start:334 stop:606 length:273 start_codon:yes stop_codon:yes gene_type:complete
MQANSCKESLFNSRSLKEFTIFLDNIIDNKNKSAKHFLESLNASYLLKKIGCQKKCKFVMYHNNKIDLCTGDNVEEIAKDFKWKYKELSD